MEGRERVCLVKELLMDRGSRACCGGGRFVRPMKSREGNRVRNPIDAWSLRVTEEAEPAAMEAGFLASRKLLRRLRPSPFEGPKQALDPLPYAGAHTASHRVRRGTGKARARAGGASVQTLLISQHTRSLHCLR